MCNDDTCRSRSAPRLLKAVFKGRDESRNRSAPRLLIAAVKGRDESRNRSAPWLLIAALMAETSLATVLPRGFY